MKIYTKRGDRGETSLFGGQRVPKNSLRIEAYGTVDELNSVVGQVRSGSPTDKIQNMLKDIQNQLFVLGADLATPLHSKNKIERIAEEDTGLLETYIDELDDALPALKHFILPGGNPPAATLHVARTICRRAERRCVELFKQDEITPQIPVYLNRLSDLLFILARYENHESGISEEAWKIT